MVETISYTPEEAELYFAKKQEIFSEFPVILCR